MERLQKELLRLKEHLLMVEETSTVEAKEAEEREMRLLRRVRRLRVEWIEVCLLAGSRARGFPDGLSIHG